MFHIPKKALLMASAKLRPQDVFATSLYTGNGGGGQVIANGIDLAGKGGLVWIKARDAAASHRLVDTARGASLRLASNETTAEANDGTSSVTQFLANGFRVGGNTQEYNETGRSLASWSFRQARGFLSIVTYTGNGVAGRQIPHDLGSVPGMIMVKKRSGSGNWRVWHRGVGNGVGVLNTTDPFYTGNTQSAGYWGNNSIYIAPTASVFTVGNSDTDMNEAGTNYVAYVFAHNPDLIDCGSYVGNASTSGPIVTCGTGWRPQFLEIKAASSSSSWFIMDAARGITPETRYLFANSSGAEVAETGRVSLLSTGFQPINPGGFNVSGVTYVFRAIREPT